MDDPDEQARLWGLADLVFPAFDEYRRRAQESGRTIALVALELEA